jgi:hypothetical protein
VVRKVVFLVLISLILAACASVPYYSFDYPLTTEVVISTDKTIQSRIPLGWFVSKDTSLTPQFLFWLIKEDYSSTIVLQEIKVDHFTEQRIKKEGLKLFAEISQAFKNESVDKFSLTMPIEIFTINSKNYCGYEYYSNDRSGRVRVILMQIGNKYFEVEAIPLAGIWYEKDLKALYNALHAFVNALQTQISS